MQYVPLRSVVGDTSRPIHLTTAGCAEWLSLAMRMRYMQAIRDDLSAVWQVSDADRRLVGIACRQLAYAAAKVGCAVHHVAFPLMPLRIASAVGHAA